MAVYCRDALGKEDLPELLVFVRTGLPLLLEPLLVHNLNYNAFEHLIAVAI